MQIWGTQDRQLDRTLQNFDAPLSETLGAAWDASWSQNPTGLLADYALNELDPGDTISAEEAKGLADSAGVSVDVPADGIGGKKLQFLIERRQDEARRNAILSRAAPGVGGDVARIGASFAASIFDPLNIASGFIPIVGEARYARMLQNATGAAGRAGVRAGVGAVEGAVGAAILEPVVYGLSNEFQDDYDMSDSLLNIMFGAGLGAGLHSLGGFIGDRAKASRVTGPAEPAGLDATAPEPFAPPPRRSAAELLSVAPPDIKEAIFRSGLSQMIEGRDLDLEQITSMIRAPDMETARVQALDQLGPEIKAELLAEASGRADPNVVATSRAELEDLSRQLEAQTVTREEIRRVQSAEKLKRSEAEKVVADRVEQKRLDIQSRIDSLRSVIDQNKGASDAEVTLSQIKDGQIPARYAERIEKEAVKLLAGPQLTPFAKAFRTHTQPSDLQALAVTAQKNQASAATASPQASRMAGEAPPRVDDVPAYEEELALAQERLDDMLASVNSPERTAAAKAELAAYDREVKRSESMAKALKSVALCGISR